MIDLLIRNIDIADGSGAPIFHGCVGVKDGRIVEVAESIADDAAKIVEGQPNELLTPGFIDTHTHDDLWRLHDTLLTSQLRQGITFDICGNCGQSPAPVNPQNFDLLRAYTAPIFAVDDLDDQWRTWTTFGAYLDAVRSRGTGIGMGFLVGEGTLRIAAMGMENRAPSAQELQHMKDMMREAMEAGALGISTGLIYAPGVYSTTEELVELCKVVAEYRGVYTTHMRSESAQVVEAVEESIDIARRSGCRLVISHHKVVGDDNHDLYKKTLALISDARKEGINVICDQYISNRSSTTLAVLFPPASQTDGTAQLLAQLKNSAQRKEIETAMREDNGFENYLFRLGAHAVYIVYAPRTPAFSGRYLDDIASELKLAPECAVSELMLRNDGYVLIALTMCREDVVDEIFKFPYTAIGSDGIGIGVSTHTHPRAYGNQVHMLETCVRKKHLVSWEEAVRKSTGLPADFYGLAGKGHITEGADADLVILDRETVGTDASFTNPTAMPRGIHSVFLGGRLAVLNNQLV